jgi:hydrogenase maturation protease
LTHASARCLILACGNTLRSDDGLGPWLAAWAENHFSTLPGLRILIRPQWTPELAEEIARAASVLFLDCSVDSPPGSIQLEAVAPAAASSLSTHHQSASELLALARDLYGSLPAQAKLLTIGAGSTELGESFSKAVQATLPDACKRLEEIVLRLIED